MSAVLGSPKLSHIYWVGASGRSFSGRVSSGSVHVPAQWWVVLMGISMLAGAKSVAVDISDARWLYRMHIRASKNELSNVSIISWPMPRSLESIVNGLVGAYSDWSIVIIRDMVMSVVHHADVYTAYCAYCGRHFCWPGVCLRCIPEYIDHRRDYSRSNTNPCRCKVCMEQSNAPGPGPLDAPTWKYTRFASRAPLCV